jgi:exodeoxyribonuclease-3
MVIPEMRMEQRFWRQYNESVYLYTMKIATYNVNGIGARLPVLLRWLKEAAPDIACLQELKAPQEKFPETALLDAGYKAIWHGQKSWNGVAILSRLEQPTELRRVLPGDPDDAHSRYIEANIQDIVVACLYLPNGNPAPGPKFDYKLNWFKRLTTHAADLLASKQPVILTGDFNVMPTEIDVYKPENWVDDALFRPEVRAAFHTLVAQGWTDAECGAADRSFPAEPGGSGAAKVGWGEPGGTGMGEVERSCAGVDRVELGRRGLQWARGLAAWVFF